MGLLLTVVCALGQKKYIYIRTLFILEAGAIIRDGDRNELWACPHVLYQKIYFSKKLRHTRVRAGE